MINTRSIKEVFDDRTCYKFLNKPIAKHLLKEIYDLMKLGPTSANTCPLRILFVESTQEKELLYKCLMPANIEKVKSAPVTAILAYDTKFYDLIPRLFPQNPGYKAYFESSENAALESAMRNSSLQAAYFMMIARSLGLDCGPMSGFDPQTLNDSFFADSTWRVNFICNIGYKDGENTYNRLPRLEFEECCKII